MAPHFPSSLKTSRIESARQIGEDAVTTLPPQPSCFRTRHDPRMTKKPPVRYDTDRHRREPAAWTVWELDHHTGDRVAPLGAADRTVRLNLHRVGRARRQTVQQSRPLRMGDRDRCPGRGGCPARTDGTDANVIRLRVANRFDPRQD